MLRKPKIITPKTSTQKSIKKNPKILLRREIASLIQQANKSLNPIQYLLSKEVTAKKLIANGFDAKALSFIFNPRELKTLGFSLSDLRKAGIKMFFLKQHGFDLKDLIEAGFSEKELLEAGFNLEKINLVKIDIAFAKAKQKK